MQPTNINIFYEIEKPEVPRDVFQDSLRSGQHSYVIWPRYVK